MPKETVQYPRTDARYGTELSVHWSRDDQFPHPIGEDGSGYVQLAMTRHVWGPRPESPDPNHLVAVEGEHHANHSGCAACAENVPAIEENRKRMEESGMPVMMSCDSTDAPPTCETDLPATVWGEPLTRGQINKLIQVLRRARDGAFGADA